MGMREEFDEMKLELDRLRTGVYAGSESHTIDENGDRVLDSYETRSGKAKWRSNRRADGKAQSMADEAASANTIVQVHVNDHPNGTGSSRHPHPYAKKGHSHKTKPFTVREAARPTGPDIDPEMED